jgi:hypothetical protein
MSARDRWARHIGQRAELHRSVWLAGYYRWCALRGHPAGGAHPLTADPIDRYGADNAALSRSVHIAMCRFYLAKARMLRGAAAVLP